MNARVWLGALLRQTCCWVAGSWVVDLPVGSLGSVTNPRSLAFAAQRCFNTHKAIAVWVLVIVWQRLCMHLHTDRQPWREHLVCTEVQLSLLKTF